ncbi:hypothetical protein V6N13_064949 [Hibiscus sabdariffa]|uniref:Uncharacterized protein n=2 Tax=Hibiscus sabdariffa TaxID=183260 RepID=A0ABR2EBN8_9ROSI
MVRETVGQGEGVQEVRGEAVSQGEAIDKIILDAVEVALQAVGVNDKVEPVDKVAPGPCSGVLQEREHDIMCSLLARVESPNKFDALGNGCGEVRGVKIDIAEQVVESPKKGQITTGGVVDLMQQLKSKAKKKGKGTCGGKRGCGSPIMQ